MTNHPKFSNIKGTILPNLYTKRNSDLDLIITATYKAYKKSLFL